MSPSPTSEVDFDLIGLDARVICARVLVSHTDLIRGKKTAATAQSLETFFIGGLFSREYQHNQQKYRTFECMWTYFAVEIVLQTQGCAGSETMDILVAIWISPLVTHQ